MWAPVLIFAALKFRRSLFPMHHAIAERMADDHLPSCWRRRTVTGSAVTGRRRPVHLFFGMRNPDSDFLYGDDLAGWQAEGRLSRLSTAVSRGAQPRHVQDALRAEAAQVADAIRQGAKVMVCGGRDMAQGVNGALEDILAPMGLTPAMLKAGGRYVEDVY